MRLIDLLSAGCGLDRLRAGGLAMLLNYSLCGGLCGLVIVAAPLTPLTSLRATDPVAADWSAAGRYAVTWLIAMVLLYTCFALTGAVFGNVIQSTRGLMSIARHSCDAWPRPVPPEGRAGLMASLRGRNTGEYVVKDYDDAGEHTLYLGRIQKRSAEEIFRHAERLVESRRANVALPPETAAWVGGVDERLRGKFERLGLIRPGMKLRRVTLAEFTDTYIEQKRPESSPRTIRNLTQARMKLLAFFGRTRRIDDITRDDAIAFRNYLFEACGLQYNAVSTHCRKSKQFFTAAAERGFTTANPFRGMEGLQEIRNEARFRFMTPELAALVLKACPSAEWRAIFSLARFGGMCPKEIIGLCWEDVRWDMNLIHLRGAKGRHKRGPRMRDVPLFPEVATALRDVLAGRPKASGRVVLGYDAESNLGVPMSRIIADAGIEDWVRVFLNLRSTRSTELARSGIPIQDFCSWLGHTPKVALEYYMQVSRESYATAAAEIVTLDSAVLKSA
ncbi:MAG: tyrosine-type recombinase/integrase [Pirellulales bacterium]